MHPMPEQPLKWLLKRIKEILDNNDYEDLMKEYKVVEERYKLASRLRHAQGEIRSFKYAQNHYAKDTERWRHYAIRIQGKESRIKRLEEKLKELGDDITS